MSKTKYLKLKTNLMKIKSAQIFLDDGIPKEGSHCIFISVILIDSVFQVARNYYPQMFLEEFKYIVKEKKMIRYITDDLEISSDDPDNEHSDKED